MRVRILPSAQADLSKACNFYEKQQPGLGSYFLDSLFADIDSLARYGGIHRRVHGAYRLLGRTFPFAIYYEMHTGTVDVKAVLDCRRDPNWIRGHLKRP